MLVIVTWVNKIFDNKKMRSVKQSSTSKALTSPTKRQILSNLVETTNTIKSKFKKAYRDRLKRERDLSETFKPITSAISAFKSPKEEIKNNEQAENSKKKVKINLKKTSSHKRSQRKQQLHLAASTPFTTRKRLSYDTIDDDETYMPFHSIPSTSTSTTLNRSNETSKSRKPDKYTYEVDFDEDLVENYGVVPPEDDTILHVRRTDKKTGEMTPLTRMKWRDLPDNAKAEYIKDREYIGQFIRDPSIDKPMSEAQARKAAKKQETIAESKSRIPVLLKPTNVDIHEERKTGAVTRSQIRKKKDGGSLKAKNNLVDFNFIPYNIKNNIIYEYFDDPNEICERLRLLVSSRYAGNTNHMQEINSIIEELRELDLIV